MYSNNLPNIIAICGYKQTGKDTIANHLVNEYGYTHYKITNKLRDVIQLLFDLNNNDYEKNKEVINDKWGITPRKMMQFIGTDLFQYKIQELLPNIDRKFWIKTLLTDELVNKINNENFKIVISDLRFIHEYTELLNFDIKVLKVTNNRITHNDTHISENEFLQIPYNYEIKNNTDLKDLYEEINKTMKSLN